MDDVDAVGERFSRMEIASVRRMFAFLFRSAYVGDLAPFKNMMSKLDREDYVPRALGARNVDGKGFLHLAAAGGRKRVCKYLLEVGNVDINMKDWKAGETPLHHAISEGRFPTVVFLLENGADPNARTKKRRTSLHYAVEYGSNELMELLISKGAEINAVAADCGTPLQYAAGKCKEGVVKFLLDHHADPNLISHDLSSPLLASISAQSLECMELLLKAGADPNFRGSKGMTPLGYAASEGLKEFIKCLLNAGADPNVSNDLGMTPIEEAALSDKRQVVRILFPLTSPIPTICEWSISGLLEQVHSDKAKEEREEKLGEQFLISKSKGDESFCRKDYFGAVQWYTEALSSNPNYAAVLSQRSLSWAKMNEGGLALEDAEACIKLRPTWPEAHYRAGAARMLFKDFKEAAHSFYHSWMLDSGNKEVEQAFCEAFVAYRNQTSFGV